MKMRVLTIPAADPGNVVGYEIDYQGRLTFFRTNGRCRNPFPSREARYTLQMPPGWRFVLSG